MLGRGSSRLVHHPPLVATEMACLGDIGEIGTVGEEEGGPRVVGAVDWSDERIAESSAPLWAIAVSPVIIGPTGP